MFCEAYGTFVEQLESAFADRMGLKTAAGFDPKQAAADFIENVYTTCPPEVYAANFFKQCEKEIGYHAIKPGLDFTLPSVESGSSSKALFGARDEETGEVVLN